LFFVLVIITVLSDNPLLMGLLIIIVPVSFAFGRRIIAKFSGPETALWLMTNNIGVSFAYLSIDLFRQDKKFSKVEMDSLCKYFAKEFGEELYGVAKEFVIKYKAKKVDLNYYTRKVRALDHRYRAMFLHQLFAMAIANGKYSKEEDFYLQNIAKLIRVSKKNFLTIKSNFVRGKSWQAQANGEENNQQNSGNKTGSSKRKNFSKQFFSADYTAYLSLNINKFATDDEVKRAYRNLVKKYHPDKLNGKAETIKKVAKQRFREITEAYELIKKERGIK